ncbi:MAG: hypothetical protein J5601_01635 [Elusimicrobiaceae bacterium]|nr:hypothetical protein [Elusimicrobiaceae bacterium]
MSVEATIKKCFISQMREDVIYHVPADFPAFKGHFPGNPLLPAVVQISFCVDALNRLKNRPLELTQVLRAKFINPILPQTTIRVSIQPKAENTWIFSLHSDDEKTKFSQLILAFKERI